MSLLYLLAILASLIIYYFVDVKLSSRSINGKSEVIWFVLFMLVYFCSKELSNITTPKRCEKGCIIFRPFCYRSYCLMP